MFKKLYRNLLLLNISVLSLLLLIVFTSLYLSTYSDVSNRIDGEIAALLNIHNTQQGQLPPDDGIVPDDGITPENFRPDRSSSFIVELDENNDIIRVLSQTTLEIDFVNTFISEAIEEEGHFDYENATWSYEKISNGTLTTIGFVDSTSDYDLLQSTLNSFIMIFVASILVTAAISSLITRKSIKPVKESFERQKQFVSDASHELKTPLTVINTNVDILLSEDKTNNKWLKYIKSEVTRMTKLTKDLLYLSNVNQLETQRLIVTKFNASEKIESVVLGIEALAYEKKIHLDYKIDPDIEINFNIEQFHQLVMILIDNAIKYTDVKGKINITFEESNNSVYLKVKNTGIGITDDEMKYIFDRFYKVDKSRETKSNSFGLGLPIAKSICASNNAKIIVESIENQYTIFTVKIKTT